MKDRSGGYIPEGTNPGNFLYTHLQSEMQRDVDPLAPSHPRTRPRDPYVHIRGRDLERSWKYLVVNESRDCTIKTCVECITRWFCRHCTGAGRIDGAHYLRSDVSLVAKVHARRLQFNPKGRKKLRDILILRNSSARVDNKIYGRYLKNRYCKFRSRRNASSLRRSCGNS